MDIKTKYFSISLATILAEFGGTFVLLFLGCLGCSGHVQYQAAVSFGMGLITAIQIFGHISGGHFNPAVTLAAVLFKTLTVPVAIIYVLSQVVGAIAGYALSMYLAKQSGSNFCNTTSTVGDLESFLIEFFATLLLILLVCSVWDERNHGNRDSIALKIGLFVFAAVQLVGPMTGASLNPARTFGPSVINNNWDMHWMYWSAPMLAGVVGALLYRHLLLDTKNSV